MKNDKSIQIMDSVLTLFIFITWIMGIVLASGFWSTFFAIIFPFWAWYLLIAKIMLVIGLL